MSSLSNSAVAAVRLVLALALLAGAAGLTAPAEAQESMEDPPLAVQWQRMWLSDFGRLVGGHVVAAVSDRLAGLLTDTQEALGGQSLAPAQMEGDEALIHWLGGLF